MTDACHCMVSRDPGPKFTKFGEQVSIGQTPNPANFRHTLTKVSELEFPFQHKYGYIRDDTLIKFVLPEKVDHSSQKAFRHATHNIRNTAKFGRTPPKMCDISTV